MEFIKPRKAHPEICFFKNFLCSNLKLVPFGRFPYSRLCKIKILHKYVQCLNVTNLMMNDGRKKNSITILKALLFYQG